MSTVAEQLRQAREAANLSVEQVAEITKMRTEHVRAIENGQYEAFSAPVYIRGFVRTYSRLLKIDTAKIMRDLDSELGHTSPKHEEANRTSHSHGLLDQATLQLSKLDWRKSLVGIIAATVLIGGFTGFLTWRKARTQDPLKDLKPGTYRPAHNAGETLPLPR